MIKENISNFSWLIASWFSDWIYLQGIYVNNNNSCSAKKDFKMIIFMKFHKVKPNENKLKNCIALVLLVLSCFIKNKNSQPLALYVGSKTSNSIIVVSCANSVWDQHTNQMTQTQMPIMSSSLISVYHAHASQSNCHDMLTCYDKSSL